MRGGDIENGSGKDSRGSNYASSAVAEREEKQWTSWLIPMFIVANIAMFVVVMFVNDCPHNIDQDNKCFPKFLGRFSFQPIRENPLLGPSASTLRKLGALEWSKVVHENQQWRLISCIWLHAGLIHIIANMLSLAFIGIRLEQQCGFLRIGVIYLLSGLGGTILSSLFIQKNISVGASGALFGLLGAMLSELIANWTIYSNKVAALLTLLVIVIINLAVGILPHVDNFAHIGGFLTGFLLGFILLPRPQYGWLDRRSRPADLHVKSKYKTYQYVLWVISFVLLVAGLTVGLVMLFRGVNGYEHCHWCHYLSCVPTSRWKCDGI